eukprot:3168206-Rhodomonas_salina.1
MHHTASRTSPRSQPSWPQPDPRVGVTSTFQTKEHFTDRSAIIDFKTSRCDITRTSRIGRLVLNLCSRDEERLRSAGSPRRGCRG